MHLSKVTLIVSLLIHGLLGLHLEFHNIFLGSILDLDKEYLQSVIDKEWASREYSVSLSYTELKVKNSDDEVRNSVDYLIPGELRSKS